MRKLALAATVVVALVATAAVAVAQSGPYSVDAATSPARAGSKQKPVTVGVKFGVSADASTGRPVSSARFKVGFGGLRSNGKAFKTCTAAKINAAGNDAGCSAAARVGFGTVQNRAGASGDLTDTSITCDLKLTIYNGGANRAALFLRGGPTVAGASCPIGISQALDARFVRYSGGGQALQFDIPSNLRHPVGGLDNAIIDIDATISKKTATVRKRGKKTKVGYFEAVGCKGGQRPISVELTSETGAVTTATGSAKC